MPSPLLNQAVATIKQTATHLDVNHNTVGNWINIWETVGIAGLNRKIGQGRNPIFSVTNASHIQHVDNYSPHLNPIEILWRFCKYKWLNKTHYKSWSKLKKAILCIFKEYGSTSTINFTKLIIKNTSGNLKLNSA